MMLSAKLNKDAARSHERGQRGYSLTELLVTITILMLVSSIMAAAVPSALRTYMDVVNASNAQVLLSTTATRLRDELSMADPSTIKANNAADDLITYVSLETGYHVTIGYDADGYLCKTEWVDKSEEAEVVEEGGVTPPSDAGEDESITTRLVPKRAAASAETTLHLRAVLTQANYDTEHGVITIANLKVVDDTVARPREKTKPNGSVIGRAQYDKLNIQLLAEPLG